MNKLLIACVGLLIFSGQLFAQSSTALSDCDVTLKNDTLTLKNKFVEVKYLWNEGNLINHSIRDLNSKRQITFASAKDSGLSFPGLIGNANNGQFSSTKVVDDLFYNDHLKVEAITQFSNVQVKRILRFYPNSPAVYTEFYFSALENHSLLVKNDKKQTFSCLEKIDVGGKNIVFKAVRFYGQTDYFNNLVDEREVISYSRIPLQGNILTIKDRLNNRGLFIYKKAPLQEAYNDYPGKDFEANGSRVDVLGTGVELSELKTDEWTQGYTIAIGIAASDNELDILTALRKCQMAEKNYTPAINDMVMMNTWGDRSKDARMSERFILNELDKCKELGVTHFQLDDGWQAGLSHNSAFKGENKAWEKWKVADWLPHEERFPNGLEPLVKKAKRLNIELGLWFNPSSHNDYEAWENDADILIGLYKRYGIKIFKIDGMQINNKKGEEQFLKFYHKVIEGTDGQVIFNLDVTAGKRFGYHFLHANNNIFLENRYTDWASYYPFRTLRNLWMLSRYVPAQSLQIEFLNKWRNAERYGNDPLAPQNLPFDYTFAITCMAQPLAWFEASGLPREAFSVAPVIKNYNTIRNDLHTGTILPIGEEPNGMSWTGFQSIKNAHEGYLLVFREWTDDSSSKLKTWLNENSKVELTRIIGKGEHHFTQKVEKAGILTFELPEKHSFALYKYRVIQ